MSARQLQQWLDVLPMILSQLNTVYMWSCRIVLVCIDYSFFVSRHRLIQRATLSKAIADSALLLEPLNAYFYTWNLLQTLEVEERSTCLRKIFKIYRRFSIWIVPLLYLAFTVAATIADLKLQVAIFDGEIK